MFDTVEGVRALLGFCGLSEEEKIINMSALGDRINHTTDMHREIAQRYKDAYGEDF